MATKEIKNIKIPTLTMNFGDCFHEMGINTEYNNGKIFEICIINAK